MSLCAAPEKLGRWIGDRMSKRVEISRFDGNDFQVMAQFEGWKIGLLRISDRFSAYRQEERHLLTDEVFVLLEGEAVLYVEGEQFSMETGTLYNVKKGAWHHIVVSSDATVMVVENSNTGAENTQIRRVEHADQ